jgi:uncharacterized membrane protein YobD (UPF0266 family)
LYISNVMMAVIIASTALVGLTGVLIGQVMQPTFPKNTRLRFRSGFAASLFIGILAVLLALLWFLNAHICGECELIALLSVLALLGQIALFIRVAFEFWSIES